MNSISHATSLTLAFEQHATRGRTHRTDTRQGSATIALEHHEQIGNRGGHMQRVARLWTHLKAIGCTPCSMATAAAMATTLQGEHCFSAAQTNAEVVRKRTADLMKCGNGVSRDWYDLSEVSQ